MPKPHPTVDRLAAILETVACRPDGVPPSELASQIRIPKSTMHTLVQGLVAVDYLQQRDGVLLIGPGIERLSSSRGEATLWRLAHPELLHVTAETGETSQLALRVGDAMLVVDQVESSQVIRYAVPLRARRPLLSTGMGKLFLAELEDADLDTFLNEHGEGDSAAGKTMWAQRHQIRSEQVAHNDEESVGGVYAIGAPVRSKSEALVAALVVAGPAYRVRPHVEQVSTEVKGAAGRLSAELRDR